MTDHPITNVCLADQLSYKDSIPAGVPYMENNCIMVMGETEDGEELAYTACIFRVGGGKEGVWQVDDKFVGQTTFVVGPPDHHEGMRDNDFIGNRSWATDDWQTGEVICTNESVIWKQGNRQIICRPPYWEVKGEHMGVECNLLLTGIGNAPMHKGYYADIEKNGVAGYEHPLSAEGTIKADGKTYVLKKEKSFACQEKFTQSAWDLAKVLRGETYYWVWWVSENVRIFIYCYPSMKKYYSHVTVDGEEIQFSDYGEDNINMKELEYWIDPKTRMQVPVKWRFNIEHANGNINLDIAAASRTFYGYLTKSGATIHYGLHSHSVGQMNLTDGRKIPLVDMRTYVETGWAAYPLAAEAT